MKTRSPSPTEKQGVEAHPDAGVCWGKWGSKQKYMISGLTGKLVLAYVERFRLSKDLISEK